MFGLMGIGASASYDSYDFEVDGIYYRIISPKDLTCSVTYKTTFGCDPAYGGDASSDYSGIVNIPSTVTYNGNNYSVTGIDAYAFIYCSDLTSITIPESITSIDGKAFYSCSSLTSVYISDLEAWCKISFSDNPLGDVLHLFLNGKEIIDMVIPNSVTSIGSFAFSNCSSLKSVTIPNSVTSIGERAFYGCNSLTSVTIPNSVTSIGDYAFSGCGSLPVINNIRYAGTYAVGAVDIGQTSYSIKEGTKWIGNNAFSGCSSLTSITFPESVISIGTSAFSNCGSLPVINNIRYAGNYAVGAVDKGQTSYSIKEGTKWIGNNAFSGCSSLTSITIPATVISIHNSAFENCNSLTSINVEDGNTCFSSENGILFDRTKETIILYPKVKKGAYTIPGTVTTIRDYTFASCTYLTKVVIPNSVTTIGNAAFRDCPHLTSITIPNSVTTIGDYAFYNCLSLTSITIPNSVTTIGNGAFSGCSGLTSVTIPNSVTTIGIHAFSGCSGITNVTIPNSVTKIGELAFSGCSSLTSVTIPNSVTKIGGYAFRGCSGLTSVSLPNSVTTIGDCAFEGCSGITSVNLPNSVKTIGDWAFKGCSGITNVTIPNSVTKIGELAFSGCSSLTSVTIPNSVTKIGGYAFQGCSSLTSLTIGNSIKIITSDDFSRCSSLREIHLGTSVEEISAGAFTSNKITDVYLLNTTPVWIFPTSFSNPEAITFHVPAGCKGAYLDSQDLWKSYTVVEDGVEAYNFEAIDANGNTVRLLLDYDDADNNMVTLLDSYKTLTIPQDIPLKQISYNRTFNNTNWQALNVPFEIPVTAEFLEHFEVAYMNNVHQYDDDDDGTIDRTIVEFFKMKSGTLKANYPYVIKAKATGTKTITVNEATLYATAENSVDCRSTQYEYVFKGTYSRMEEDELTGCYAMSGGGWKTLSAGSHLNPFRVYLRITPRESGLAPLKSIGMRIIGEDGETTEINSQFIIDNSPLEEAPVFDLAGRRVENPTGGIYIVNGKKVVIR